MDSLENYDSKFAIIILNWNGYKNTINCVKSILNQNFDSNNIFIIDNGSTDNSFSILSEQFSNIKNQFKLSENIGFSGGMNYGMNLCLKSGYKYAILLNNDTEFIQKSIIGAYVEALSYSDKVAIVSPRIAITKDGIFDQKELIVDSVGFMNFAYKYLFPPYPRFWFNDALVKHKELNMIEVPMLHGVAIGVNLKIIKRIGLFDENFFCYEEDRDLIIRAKKAGYKVFKILNRWIYHKWSDSTSKNSAFIVYYRSRNLWLMRNQYYSKRYIIFSYLKLFIVSLKYGHLRSFFSGVKNGYDLSKVN